MPKRILVTGAFGQIGSELTPALQKKYGADNVVALGHHKIPAGFAGIVEQAEVAETSKLNDIIKRYDIGTVYHLVSLLSAKGEKDPELAWQVNLGGLKSILDLAREYKLKVFWPSSIAAFGPATPKEHTPQHTIMEPTTMYGVTKVAGELLCQYCFVKYGLDIRSLRYPGIVTYKTEPSDGTTEYSIAMFYEGIRRGRYQCFLKPDTVLPMMYIDDAIRATLELMDAPAEKITVRTSYNLAAISFTPQELAAEFKKHLPELEVTYQPDFHQPIADSWPQSIDDLPARQDWGWSQAYDLPKLTQVMLQGLRQKFASQTG